MAKRLRSDSISPEFTEDRPPNGSAVDTREHTPKYVSIDEKSESTSMRCLLPPHRPLGFISYDEYESHYQQAHTNRCSECHNNFPSTHMLELHIAENHDPILAAKRDAGERTYRCFVEGCDKVCLEWKKRRSHLIDKHAFPKNYDFFIVNSGIDGRWSMLRPGIDADGHRKSSRERGKSHPPQKSSTASEKALDSSADQSEKVAIPKQPVGSNGDLSALTDETVNRSNRAIDDLSNSMSSLKMVPRSIKFGQGTGRAGFAKK